MTAPVTGSFTISTPGKFTDDQFTTNWDREFNGGQDKIAVRFFFSNSDTFAPFRRGRPAGVSWWHLASSRQHPDLNFPSTLLSTRRFLNVTETHLFSPTLVNEFRFGFVHINDSLQST